MWRDKFIAVRDRIEAYLRIDASLDAGSRLRARIIYLVAATFIAMQFVNMASLATVYGGWDFQHNIALLTIGVFAVLTFLLRYTKSPVVFGLLFGALPIVAIGTSALGTDSWIDARGIETPLLPLLAASLAFIAYCGTRLTNTITLAASLLLIFALYRYSLGLVPDIDEATQLIFYQRALQAVFTTTIVAIVSIVISHIIFRTLDRLETALERASIAEAARTEMMNTMSHELRTPLNGIIAMSDMLARSESLDTDDKASAELIQTSADTLLDMLNQTLDRAKSEAGHAQMRAPTAQSEPFSPAALIQQVCALFSASATAKGVWLGASGTDDLPDCLLGDPGQLRQVLSNLIGNAVKFTHAGGVRVGATLAPVSPYAVDLLFYVQDTGTGIAAEDQMRILQPFEQCASAKTTETKGTGLGLSICVQLVEAMGGRLELDSQPGRGSTFHFTLRLPVGRAERLAPGTEAAAA